MSGAYHKIKQKFDWGLPKYLKQSVLENVEGKCLELLGCPELLNNAGE